MKRKSDCPAFVGRRYRRWLRTVSRLLDDGVRMVETYGRPRVAVIRSVDVSLARVGVHDGHASGGYQCRWAP